MTLIFQVSTLRALVLLLQATTSQSFVLFLRSVPFHTHAPGSVREKNQTLLQLVIFYLILG